MIRPTILLGILLMASSTDAQITSPSRPTLHYDFHAGTELHYIVTDEQSLLDPKHTAMYTDEYSDTSYITLHVDSVRGDGIGIVTLDQTIRKHHDLSRSPDQDEHALKLDHNGYMKSVRIVVNKDGGLLDSAIVELTSDQQEYLNEFYPKDRANISRDFIRDYHRDFLSSLPLRLKDGDVHWSDTLIQPGVSGTMSMPSGAASENTINNQVVHVICTRIYEYNFTPDVRKDGVNCSRLLK